MSPRTRNMNGTWRSANQLGWSKPRLLAELRGGRAYRTSPPGIEINWEDPLAELTLDLVHSETRVVRGQWLAKPPILERELVTVGFEIWDGQASPVPPPAANAPAGSSALRRPSDAAVNECYHAIKAERPDDPPGENELFEEMTRRLGASPGRERLRGLRRKTPEWKRPQGRPRKNKSAGD